MDKSKILIEIDHDICDLCGCCVGICPEDAMELTITELSIIEEHCTNCSKCVWCCPVEALNFNYTGTGV